MDEPPGWLVDEWNLFMAAKWAGVGPWELAEQPVWWKNRLLFFMNVEQGLGKVKRGSPSPSGSDLKAGTKHGD